ncbi:coiled-coil domain-containing protein [Brumimicrobium mesophilum]|uniref:hypothetical protein n=1 Tax=Brumimicrobium mesophilum TaxID=392717 RepID=UPI000D1432E2|nr:hypothetical protein [Brumimicrobium mesophilum]
MNKNIIFLAALFIGISFNGISQDEDKINTIEAQFQDLIESSNDYQAYKVIEKSKLKSLQKNIQDSIIVFESEILESSKKIQEQKSDIDSSHQEIESLNAELKETQSKVDNIDFMGISTQKSTFTTIMLSIILVLLIISLVMFFVFKKGQKSTKLAKEKLTETQLELDNHRKRSLEREQKVRRELQDELNKRSTRKD